MKSAVLYLMARGTLSLALMIDWAVKGVVALVVIMLMAVGAVLLPVAMIKAATEDVGNDGAATENDAAKNYQRQFQMMAGEAIQHVSPPFRKGRMAYIRKTFKLGPEAEVPQTMAVFFRWTDGKLKWHGMTVGQGKGAPLTVILNRLAGVAEHEIEAANDLKYLELPGDFAVNTSASTKQVVKQLQEILNKRIDARIRLSLREIEKTTYVARGVYKFTPIDKRRREIEIYGDQVLADSEAGGGSGNFGRFLQSIGGWIGHPVVSDVKRFLTHAEYGKDTWKQDCQR